MISVLAIYPRPCFVFLIGFVLVSSFHSATGQNAVQVDSIVQQADDGFTSVNNDEFTEIVEPVTLSGKGAPRGLQIGLAALFFTIMAGFLVRFKRTRPWRSIFLLTSLVVLGFWNGGCPCSISSFQNIWLWLMGQEVKLHSLIWFLALIPITYFFGRVWCGWVCHLGAFQEFLYRHNHPKLLKSETVQKILKTAQYVLFAVLMIQLFITKSNIFIHYDPFKVAFNMASFHLLGWILLGGLLLVSLFLYRPFCRGVCPVGLVLGWVTKLPYASKLRTQESCTACGVCSRSCNSQAVGKKATFHSQLCILCGDCLDKCKSETIFFSRKE